jgi:hypothetical protein
VDRAADTVPAKLADHREAAAPDGALDRATYFTDELSDPPDFAKTVPLGL